MKKTTISNVMRTLQKRSAKSRWGKLTKEQRSAAMSAVRRRKSTLSV